MARQIITHKIPKLEFFEVAEFELDQIDSACRLPERYLVLLSISVTSLIALGIAWASGAGSETYLAIFGVLAIVASVLTIFAFVKWLQTRNVRIDAVKRIRDRKVDPSP